VAAVFDRTFGGREPHLTALLDEVGRLIVERLAGSDALYHNAEHTVLVTLVGQDILRGLRLCRSVSPEDWLHFMIAALMHDIGYVRGVCSGDCAGRYAARPCGLPDHTSKLSIGRKRPIAWSTAWLKAPSGTGGEDRAIASRIMALSLCLRASIWAVSARASGESAVW
jgi:hypothetical protein